MFQPAFAVDYRNYTSQLLGISFEYPATWSVNETTSHRGITIDGQSLENGAFVINLDNISPGELDSILQDPKSKYSVLYFGYNFLKSISPDSAGEIIEEPYSLPIGPFKGESMVYQGGVLGILQDWYVALPDGRSYKITYSSPSDRFDSPESKDIRAAFIRSIHFLNVN